MKRIFGMTILVIAIMVLGSNLVYGAAPGDQTVSYSAGVSANISGVFTLVKSDQNGAATATQPSFSGTPPTSTIPWVSEPFGANKSSMYLVARNNYNSTDVPNWYIKLSATVTGTGPFTVDDLWYFVGTSSDTQRTKAYDRNTGLAVGTEGVTHSGLISSTPATIGYGWKKFSGTATTVYTATSDDKVNTPLGTMLGLPVGLDTTGGQGTSVTNTYTITVTLSPNA